VAYSLAEVRFVPQFFEAGVRQKKIDVLPCAYFAANKSYEHESRLALKALHALSLTDADSEVRKRSIRLYKKGNFSVKMCARKHR
jgi:hypothetical protein